MHDPAAAGRLWTEVQRAFAKPGRVTSKSALSQATGITRPTLDNWLIKGIQPTADGMVKMAEALGVDAAMLWLRLVVAFGLLTFGWHLDYLQVMRDAEGLGLTYLLWGLPIVAVPLVGYLRKTRRPSKTGSSPAVVDLA